LGQGRDISTKFQCEVTKRRKVRTSKILLRLPSRFTIPILGGRPVKKSESSVRGENRNSLLFFVRQSTPLTKVFHIGTMDGERLA